MQLDGVATSRMRIWGTVSLANGSLSRLARPVGFYDAAPRISPASDDEDVGAKMDELQSNPPYCFDEKIGVWEPCTAAPSRTPPRELSIASYNVLAEFAWPPSQARYPVLVKNILSSRAAADVLVLQEVSDDFLSYLLRDEAVRAAYPFVSHGPPDQPDIEPLPSFLNLVVLSKWAFDWEWVSFKRQHKGSVIVKFNDIGKWEDADFLPAILATVHLTRGLTNGSVSNKKTELQRLLNYLEETYPDHPWIVAGDFNISTSSFSIEQALEKNAISSQTAEYVARFEKLFALAGLVDGWSFARHDLGDASDSESCHGDDSQTYGGEQGATMDPTTNPLAAEIMGSGLGNRPQRYDRILVRGKELLSIAEFNKFGFLTEPEEGDAEPVYASDHWGVRCLLRVGSGLPEKPMDDEVSKLVVPVHLKKAPSSLADTRVLRDTLSGLGVFPADDEAEAREGVFRLLKSVLIEAAPGEVGDSTALGRLRSSLVVVPVGSYGLGVWTPSSDMDCLCIGPLSSKTFFALATQRLRKAAAQGVKILRRVRANSGTMLELEVHGIKLDLQYCAAAAIAEQWPDALRRPASDPVFALPAQTLSKLKAIRDLDYLRRSVPDMATFRLAHRFVKTWAASRGIYSAKFGYLGGFQIALLLARVYKLLARDVGTAVSVSDLLTTFFSHYAAFDWQHQIVFDPFFHRQRMQYARSAREPLAILGYFPPALNTAHAASVPSVRTVAAEFSRAGRLLSEEGMTWSRFLCGSTNPPVDLMTAGAADFLTAYKSYVKIDVHYWGLSLAKGTAFVGWLESRCVMVLVDINRRLPNIHARMWPARLVEHDKKKDSEAAAEDRDYQGCYLIGLDMLDGANLSRDELKIASGALHTVLARFEEMIRGHELHFDANAEWMSADVVRQAELGDLRADTREWGSYTPGDDESDDTEEEEDGSLGEEDEAEGAPSKKKNNNKKKTKKPATAPRLEPGKKFRAAQDVVARLRWDPSLDSGDYVVGYKDRFIGAQERPLDLWKSDLTDEEFIPQHRVLYFKRKSDGAVVWERKTRRDEIFGSGV